MSEQRTVEMSLNLLNMDFNRNLERLELAVTAQDWDGMIQIASDLKVIRAKEHLLNVLLEKMPG